MLSGSSLCTRGAHAPLKPRSGALAEDARDAREMALAVVSSLLRKRGESRRLVLCTARRPRAARRRAHLSSLCLARKSNSSRICTRRSWPSHASHSPIEQQSSCRQHWRARTHVQLIPRAPALLLRGLLALAAAACCRLRAGTGAAVTPAQTLHGTVSCCDLGCSAPAASWPHGDLHRCRASFAGRCDAQREVHAPKPPPVCSTARLAVQPRIRCALHRAAHGCAPALRARLAWGGSHLQAH